MCFVNERKVEPVVHTREIEGDLVRINGVIDETLDVAALAKLLEGAQTPVVFDLDTVPYITSYGVREWMTLLCKLHGRAAYFARCRPGVANQFNMISRFGGDGVLVSMFCPFVCTSCGHEIEVLFDRRRFEGPPVEFALQPQTCPKCGKPAELDDLPEAYFAHVASLARPIVPPAVSTLIDGKKRVSRAKRFSAAKEVKGELTAIWLFGHVDKRARLDRLATGLEGDVLFLFDGVELMTPEGLLSMTAVLNQPGARFHLARVPWSYLAGPLGQEVELGRAKIVSIVHPNACRSCGHETKVDLDADARARVARGEKVLCPSCMELTQVAPLPDSVKHLPILASPPAVKAYLDEHPDADSAPSRPIPDAGDNRPLILEKYRVLRRLGAGGMSEVFLCTRSGPEGFEKPVVIKKMLPHLSGSDAFTELFLQEARMAARITHSNVVQIFDLERSGHEFYISMEYVPGWDLSTVVKCCRSLGVTIPVELAITIACGVCSGLTAAHNCTQLDGTPYPIIHRDISPHNVLLSRDGEVKVADFGIAKANDSRPNTEPGDLKGKAGYLAPEVIDGAAADVRSDLFATGLVLYLMLTLKHPFDRAEEMQTLLAVVNAPVPSIRGVRPDVSPQLDAAVRKALAKDPAQRYASAREMKLALEEALGAQGGQIGRTRMLDWLRDVMDDAKRQGLVTEHTHSGSAGAGTGGTVTTPARMIEKLRSEKRGRGDT